MRLNKTGGIIECESVIRFKNGPEIGGISLLKYDKYG
jgi:hypothetical protein